MVFLVLGACFLPLVFWCFHALRSDVLSAGTVLVGFFCGLAAVLVGAVAVSLASVALSGTLAVCIGAFIEELLKLLAVSIAVCTLKNRNSLKGLLAVAALVGLSFASFENIAYAITNPSSLILRSITSVPLHASLAVIAAMSLAGRFGRPAIIPAGWFVIAVVFHAVFNIALDISIIPLLPALLFCAGFLWIAVHLWKRAGADPEEQ